MDGKRHRPGPSKYGEPASIRIQHVSKDPRLPPVLRLPPAIFESLIMLLPVESCLQLISSCKRLHQLFGPGGKHEARLWQKMFTRIGWRERSERHAGKPGDLCWSVPPSMAHLLERELGIEDEVTLARMMTANPRGVFMSVYGALLPDYRGFRSLERRILPVFLARADSARPGTQAFRTAAEVALRLDQLLWFARGHLVANSARINRRLGLVVHKFEAHYMGIFERAFGLGDTETMRMIANILKHLRQGRCCIQYLTGVHPLVNVRGYTDECNEYHSIVTAGSAVRDAASFGSFFTCLTAVLKSHSTIVSACLPSPELALYGMCALVDALFLPGGLAHASFNALFASLRQLSRPSEAADGGGHMSRASASSRDSVVTARRGFAVDSDHVFLDTVTHVVKACLVEIERWAEMQPTPVPRALARRNLFSMFQDVIVEYSRAEIKILERLYAREIERWQSKLHYIEELFTELPTHGEEYPAKAQHRQGHRHHASNRMLNFQQRVLDVENYKYSVLDVFKKQLGITQDLRQVETQLSMADSAQGGSPAIQPEGSLTGLDNAVTSLKSLGDILMKCPISIDLCHNVIIKNHDAVKRLAVFTSAPPHMRLGMEARQAIEEVFLILLRSIGQQHVRPAFEQILPKLQELENKVGNPMSEWHGTASQSRDRTPADEATALARIETERELQAKCTSAQLRFFEMVHIADLVVQMIEIYFKKDMTDFVSETDFLNSCIQEMRALERMVDDSVAAGMDIIIEVIIRQIQHILQEGQSASDYNPSDDASLQLKPTLTCVHAVQLLTESTEIAQSMTTNKQVREVFLGEIGLRLFNTLIAHIKRFQISEPGGFQLIADLNLFNDWAMRHLEDPDNLAYFAALKDLANCFILAPKDLRPFLRDQYTRRKFDSIMRLEEVYDIVACRADYRHIRTMVEGHCEFM
ncbi:F-box protein: endocytic membrane traffic, recycling ReCYcling 1 [Spiromyces aspiralis]|uniref:F-box protein: endocytic membrane traffic, recycling ReCYcling 1 n=1 Tax=Spiromyces aspiralis TaxID=68401 RepID=A0ACC1HY77_9FUNG|nr:F-box protein: endocytic membrane traffic, recycling ReCYcling 1 [Spiromyces aspiralis]